jgi:hypothetical protein
MNRKRVMLAALLGALSVALVYAYLATPRLEKAPPRIAPPLEKAEIQPSEEVPFKQGQQGIDFDSLVNEPRDFPGAQRDIFRFAPKRPVRTAPPVAVVPPPVVKPVEPPEPVEVLEAPPRPLSTFTYLGFLDKAGEKTVFLSSGGKIFLAKQGERFGVNQEFIVDEIFGGFLDVRPVDGGRVISVPLIEKDKLRFSVSAPASREPRPEVSIPQPRQRTLLSRNRTAENNEETLPGTANENNPDETQQSEPPAEGDVLEGDVNGTNQ